MKGEPKGAERDLGTGRGLQKGGQSNAGNGGRRRQAVQGAETSGRGWRVAIVGDVQVSGAPLWEKWWGLGSTERCYNDERPLMVGR